MRTVHAVRSDGFAGVERHVAVLSRAQADLGHQVHVIGGRAPDMLEALRGSGVAHTPAETTTEVARELVQHRGATVLHVHMTAAEVAALVTQVVVRTPIVVTRHFAGDRLAGNPLRVLAPLMRRRFAAQVAVSEYVAEAVDGSATVIYPGVQPVAGMADIRSKVVLVAQRNQPEKEIGIALRAFAASGLASQGWRLWVAGRGTTDREVLDVVRHLGLTEHADVLGPRPDIGLLMLQASILVAPCRVEGLGLTVLEAMARGLPVVAAAAGGHLETVGAVGNDFLFPPGDPNAAGESLQTLANQPEMAAAYGRRLQQVQRERFTPVVQARQTLTLYEEVIGA